MRSRKGMLKKEEEEDQVTRGRNDTSKKNFPDIL